ITDRLAGPQPTQQRDRRREARTALVERHATGLEFFREFAAYADAENQAAFAEMVERRDLLCDGNGVAQRHEIDIRAEPQAAADDRRLRQLQQRIEDRDGKGDMVADP